MAVKNKTKQKQTARERAKTQIGLSGDENCGTALRTGKIKRGERVYPRSERSSQHAYVAARPNTPAGVSKNTGARERCSK